MVRKLQKVIKKYARTGKWVIGDLVETQRAEEFYNLDDMPEVGSVSEDGTEFSFADMVRYKAEAWGRAEEAAYEYYNLDLLQDILEIYYSQLLNEATWIRHVGSFPDGKPLINQNPCKVKLWEMLLSVSRAIEEGYKPQKKS